MKYITLPILLMIGIFSTPLVALIEMNPDDTLSLASNIPRPFDHEALLQIVNERAYVMQAHILQGPHGYTIPVASSINFISVSGEEATLQLALNTTTPSPNGLGGVTLEGKLSGYEVKDRGDQKGVYVKMRLLGSGKSFDLFMNISDSGNGTIDVRSNNGDRLRYRGELVPLNDSDTFKGTTTF